MRYTPYIITALIGLVLLSTSGCEEDFELNAPYERIPIIYGLLDAGVDTQFVMINRSYLGDGNALDYTTVEDSMLYNEVEAFISWGSGQSQRVQLQPITRTEKDINGIFFAPTQTVYYALTEDMPPLEDEEDNSRFDLEIIADGEKIEASTRVCRVELGDISKPANNANIELRLVSSFNLGIGADYRDLEFEFNLIDNAVTHEAIVIFNYTDVTADGEMPRQITVPYGRVDKDVDETGEVSIERGGEEFYSRIGAVMESRILEEGSEDVLHRAIGDVDFLLLASGEDLSTYRNVGDPVSAVGQERPTYSNINDGDAVGIFSSRGSTVLTKSFKALGEEGTPVSMQELIRGQYTDGYCFCDPSLNAPSIWRCGSSQNCE